MPVVVVTGARQTGKSTLVQNLKETGRRQFYTLDDFDILAKAQKQPMSLLDQSTPITIDEVQLQPELLKYIKQIVDKKRTPGQFLLTGSANLLLMKQVSESLAGRAGYLILRPLTCRETFKLGPSLWGELLKNPDQQWLELLKNQTLPEQDWRLLTLKGGLPVPRLHLKNRIQRDVWFDGYIRTYLERDLQNLSTIAFLPDFRRLMRLLSIRVGQIANQNELSRSVGLSQPTTHRYINLLEMSYMLTRLPAYTVKKSKRLIKSPKFYWADTGLGLHLSQEKPQGKHLENWILNDLLSWRDASLTRADLFYWRTTGGLGVDFVIETTDGLLPVEVKTSTKVRFKDTLNLQAFRNQYSQSRSGLLLYAGSELSWITPDVLAVPWWLI